MDKRQVMKHMHSEMKTFKYIFNKQTFLKENLWHYNFKMDVGLPDIQMSLEFCDTFLDVLAFPHPIIVNKKNYDTLLKMINYINWNIKGIGHMYIDDNLDIAYSLRIKYSMFEKMPLLSMQEVKFSVDVFADVIKLLYDISVGRINYEEGKREIDLMWRPIYEK